MKEPVDNMLSGRIKQVFDDFEDPTADAGWKELRKKYPRRSRRPLFLWLSSAAALLIVATGIWLTDPEEKLALKPAKEKEFSTDKAAPVPNPRDGEQAVIARKADSESTADKMKLILPDEENPSTPTLPNIPATKGEHIAVASGAIEMPREGLVEEVPGFAPPEDILLTKEAALVRNGQEEFAFVPIDKINKPARQQAFSPEPVVTEKKIEQSDKSSNKLAVSFFAGSHFNYSEGSENQLNFGAGIVSDIRISKNLKLSTGISIASNSLNYASAMKLPSSAYSSFNSTLNPASGNLTTITSYNASLLALDIPVNIKYQVIPESNKFYVQAGLSSGTYLNETYAYQYRNFSTASGNYVSQTQDQKIKKQLNDFDLGRTLNLSLGLSTGLGKTQVLSIEPFLKYPLSGLGTENLRFGSAGINFKIGFTPQKK